MAMRRAVFFTIDSLLASGIIIIAVLLVGNFYSSEQQRINVNYASQDLVRVFSTMTVGEVNNDYAKALILDGEISNANSTILEQIGDFWAGDKADLARNFTRNLTEDIFPPQYGFSVLVNGEEIYSRNISVKKALVSSRKMITGIAKAKPTDGFTSRVLLTGIKSKKTSAYAYFGGYEGDGNLTKRLILPNDVISFNSSYLEADSGGNFDLYINGLFSGSYVKGSSGGGNMLADKWNLSNAYLANFRAGGNIININFTSGSSYIAGGFLRVTYTTSSYNDTQTAGYEKYWLPGIDGIINLYSSVYSPAAINNMNIFLNYSSNYTTYLRIGNTTVYENNTGGVTAEIKLQNSTLKDMVDYNLFNQKTVPLRMGIKNVTIPLGNVDVILITDVSGSMGWRLDSDVNGVDRTCDDPNIYSPDTKRISLAKCLDKQFIDIVLNSSSGPTTNRVGIISYSGKPSSIGSSNSIIINYTHDLSSDNVSLKNQIELYAAKGATGICGSIRKARQILQSQSDNSRKKFVIVMTDGVANVQCDPVNLEPTTGCIPEVCPSNPDCGIFPCSNNYCYGGTQNGCVNQNCGDWQSDTASSNAIGDACRLFSATGATVHSIGFGPVSSCSIGTQTLLQIANCGGGSFSASSDANELNQIYKTLAKQIVNVTYAAQTVNTSLTKSIVYPSSYIEFNYTAQDTQFNKIPLVFETGRFGNNVSSGTLTIYANTSLQDAKVTSYSGSKWTDNFVVNGNTIYRLTDYGNDYQLLGDPFAVNIPVGNINQGGNSITISTGLNSTSSTGGSFDNKVIYNLLLNGFADYSAVVAKSDGCSWNVGFEDDTFSTIKVPSTYSGGDLCSYTSASKTYDADDALDNGVYALFNNLDIDNDGKLDVNINENNLDINTLTISKVPSLWGPAIIEIRVWE